MDCYLGFKIRIEHDLLKESRPITEGECLVDKRFIAKLQTDNYLIGSFDSYLEQSKLLIKNSYNVSDDEVDTILEDISPSYRAAIVDKKGEYIGYIGLYNIDSQNNFSSIIFGINGNLNDDNKNEILDEYKKYLFDSLNIREIEELIYITSCKVEVEQQQVISNSSIIIPSKFLISGISKEDLDKFSKEYLVPKLQLPFTIKSNDRTIGIIGLSNLVWSNKTATLNIFLDKSLGDAIINELPGYIIDDYVNYLHSSSVHNVTLSVNGSNKNMLNILKDTNMTYYGQIPFAAINGDNIESNLMFQHVPNMEKTSSIFIPQNNFVSLSVLNTEKKSLAERIELDNDFKMISPKCFGKEKVDFNHVLQGHIKAMQNRDEFAIPLDKDKYFLQQGNSNYGLYKALMNYTYVVLNENNDYAGYVNILRSNADGKNMEVEIGIDPRLQHKGLGTKVINRFYDELFSIGVASVTSAVFDFNAPSIKLHEKVAELNGIRLESYYINGKLWDMNYYTKTNDVITANGYTKISK